MFASLGGALSVTYHDTLGDYTLQTWPLFTQVRKELHDMYCMMDIIWPISQITIPYVLFIFIEMKVIHHHFCMMFVKK